MTARSSATSWLFGSFREVAVFESECMVASELGADRVAWPNWVCLRGVIGSRKGRRFVVSQSVQLLPVDRVLFLFSEILTSFELKL